MYTWSDIGFLVEKKTFFWMQDIHGSQIKETARKVKVFFAYFVISAKYTVVTIKKNNVWQSVSLLQKKEIKKPKAKVLHASEN